MTYSEIKNIVGIAGDVKVKSSSFRFSEFHSLATHVSVLRKGSLTIVVESGTLSNSEILTLAKVGDGFVNFDLTQG